MTIKNCPGYLFSDNLIVNVKDFEYNLLEINKLSLKGVFIFIHYILITLNTSLRKVLIV